MNHKLLSAAAAMLAAAILTACGPSAAPVSPSGAENAPSGQMHIIATIYPEYDWVREILGDNPAGADLKLLMDSGKDLHSYQPSASDMINISSCDLFIYVGGESDKWVGDALKEAVNKDMVVLNLMDILGSRVREEELVEGMQEHDHGEEHDHDEGHDHDEDHDHEDHPHGSDEVEYDEHVWLSLKNAAVCCGRIADALSGLDPEHAGAYRSNADAYCKKLDELDGEYRSAVSGGTHHTLLFGDRFPFRYLTDEYGLDYYAAFAGCSAETEASFETISFLSSKLDELGLPCVLTIEGSDRRIAETIVQNTGSKDQEILTMNSLQSVSGQDASGGFTYLSAMEDNLQILKKALD